MKRFTFSYLLFVTLTGMIIYYSLGFVSFITPDEGVVSMFQLILAVAALAVIILVSIFSPSPTRALLFGIISFLSFLITYSLSKQIRVKEDIVIKLEAIIQEDDVFQAFVLPEAETAYSEKFSMSKTIEGSSNPQTLVFTLGDLGPIKGIRIDLGDNKNQRPIQLLSIEVKGNGYINQSGPKIYDYFGWNEFVKYDPTTQLISTQPLTNSYSEYDPSIFMRDVVAYSKGENQNHTVGITALILSILIAISIYITLLSVQFNEQAISQHVTFLVAFILILIAPLIDNWFEFEINKNSTEKRTLAKKPSFAETPIREYPLQFEQYYNDHVGFRNVLVNWSGRLKSIVFVSSVDPEKLVIGKDRWLFMYGEWHTLVSIRNENPLHQEELEKIAKTAESHKAVLDSLHIKHYISCWPDKHTIYPEYLPNSLQWQRKNGPTRLDQVIEHLNNTHSPVKLLDVRPTLIASKNRARLYMKNDTHWNSLGAFYAFQLLEAEIAKDFPELNPLQKESDYSIEWKNKYAGDILGLMGLETNRYYPDPAPDFTSKENRSEIISLPVDGYIPKTVYLRNNLARTKLRVIVFRDSFTTALIPFLSADFYEVLYLWTGYDQKSIDEFKPDIVIEGFAERLSFYP